MITLIDCGKELHLFGVLASDSGDLNCELVLAFYAGTVLVDLGDIRRLTRQDRYQLAPECQVMPGSIGSIDAFAQKPDGTLDLRRNGAVSRANGHCEARPTVERKLVGNAASIYIKQR